MFSFLAPRMLVQRRTANKSKAKSERDWRRDTERPPWEYGSINFPSGGFEVQACGDQISIERQLEKPCIWCLIWGDFQFIRIGNLSQGRPIYSILKICFCWHIYNAEKKFHHALLFQVLNGICYASCSEHNCVGWSCLSGPGIALIPTQYHLCPWRKL